MNFTRQGNIRHSTRLQFARMGNLDCTSVIWVRTFALIRTISSLVLSCLSWLSYFSTTHTGCSRCACHSLSQVCRFFHCILAWCCVLMQAVCWKTVKDACIITFTADSTCPTSYAVSWHGFCFIDNWRMQRFKASTHALHPMLQSTFHILRFRVHFT